jgi:integrase
MRVAVRYAVAREELDRDPFRNIGEAAETPREKGVLTPDEIVRLIAAPISDLRHRLAVLLGALCGMRMGEVRGLQWGDVENGLIHVRHNWQNMEGMKAPKYKGGAIRENPRTVPLPSSIAAILETLRQSSTNPVPNSFVIESYQKNGEPVSKEFFRYVLDKEQASIGIPGTWKPSPRKDCKRLTNGEKKQPADYVNEQKRRNITYHGLRHSYVTLGRLAGITDIEIQTLAGHRSGAMMERYSHAAQVLDFQAAREKLEKAIGG